MRKATRLTFLKSFRSTTAMLALLALAACADKPAAPPPKAPEQAAAPEVKPQLQQIATFQHQVTGVSVARDGRVFVNFPRWTDDAPVSVALVQADGSLQPYPDAGWNAWRKNGKDKAGSHFICVQSVVADGQNNLWVVDAGAPAMGKQVPGGPKLVKIDLGTNQVAQIIPLGKKIAPAGSYPNDIRISPDGAHAYLTDSGKGALIVIDLKTLKARRLLDEAMSTGTEAAVTPQADGRDLRRPDGRTLEAAADGIALSAAGDYLYWQALKGKTLYRIATAALHDEELGPEALEAKVERVGETHVADGLWIDGKNRLYVTAPEIDAITYRDDSGRLTPLVRDAKLRWPDTLAQGPDGMIYVTASHIQDMPWFKPGAPENVATALFKITPP